MVLKYLISYIKKGLCFCLESKIANKSLFKKRFTHGTENNVKVTLKNLMLKKVFPFVYGCKYLLTKTFP